jgi:hypothetical protein
MVNLLAFLGNTRPGLKGLGRTNTLAYMPEVVDNEERRD